MKLLVLFCSFICFQPFIGNAITIQNTTHEHLFLICGAQEDNKQNKTVYEIYPGSNLELQLENYELNETIFAHKDKAFLENSNLHNLLIESAHYPVAEKLYLIDDGDQLIICPSRNPLSYFNEQILYPLNNFNEKNLDYLHRFYAKHTHSDFDAHVRTGTDICREEKEYIAERKNFIKPYYEKFLGIENIEKVPTIAVCFSGGGYRAMLATIGFLTSAEESGLLDLISYSASLSGSTWAIGLWHSLKITPHALKEYVKERINKDLFKGKITVNAISSMLYKKMVLGRKISLIDFYGGLLSRRLLDQSSESPHEFLHAQTDSLSNHSMPYPIYTSVILKPDNTYAWMEFTPHEIGSDYLQAFIPSWALGRAFYNGISTTRAPAEKLGFLFGVWGSAFSANLKEIYTHTKNDLKSSYLTRALGLVSKHDTMSKIRLASTKVRNFTQGMKDSPLSSKQYITMLDAGLDFNLPFPPILRKERAIDIIIVIDASASEPGEQLLAAQQYAKLKDCPFAYIDQKLNAHCIVLRGNNSSPTIMYLPLIKNNSYDEHFDPQESCKNGYCRTANFVYKLEQVDQISGLIHYTLQEQISTIKHALRENHVKN